MFLSVLKSRIEKACVTGLLPNEDEEVTVPYEIMQAAGFVDHERVMVTNLNNGRRFETVICAGKPRSHQVELKGAAALWATLGDRITILAFAVLDQESARTFRPRSVILDKDNHQTMRADTYFA
jgi:aspartate 1-decarboxylase